MGSSDAEQIDKQQSNTDRSTTDQSTTERSRAQQSEAGRLTAEQIRQRLVEISDGLRELEHDDFMGKHRLYAEADELRNQLAEFENDQPDASSQWAERAARKASHAVDQKVVEAMLDQHMDGGIA